MTSFLRRVSAALLVAAVMSGPAILGAQQPPAPVDEFVPIDQLPQQEQIPAANLLVPAYAFVWLAVLVYVVSVARRMSGVERDVQRLESELRAKK